MATRRIPAEELYFLVNNPGPNRICVCGLNLAPGQTLPLAARAVSYNYSRAVDLANLVASGKITVVLKGENLGYVAPVPVTAMYLKSLQAPTAAPLGMAPTIATVDRPVATQVPAGFGLYNSTTTVPNFSDGTVYKNAAGAPV